MKTKYTHESLIGKTYNGLTYDGNFHKVKFTPFARWKCICGNAVDARITDVVRGKKKSCNCFVYRRKSAHYLWGGCGDISGNYWSIVVSGAKSRKLEITISIEDAWNQFVKQNGKCALTGMPLDFGTTKRAHDITASLDRINSSKGYIIDNIQWVHKKINVMKMDTPQNEFIEWCKKVSDYQVLKK